MDALEDLEWLYSYLIDHDDDSDIRCVLRSIIIPFPESTRAGTRTWIPILNRPITSNRTSNW